MKPGVVALLTVALCVILPAAPAMGHHSFAAEFDANKPVVMTGFVTKIEWTNPHVWFYINVKDAGGKFTNWGFEMGPPHGLQSRGWTRTTLKLGDEVTVSASLAKDGRNRGNAKTVKMTATGQTLGAASSEGVTP